MKALVDLKNETIFASSDPDVSHQISKLVEQGCLKKIAPRLYTTNFVDSHENIIKRNFLSIIMWRFPNMVISHRSANEMRITPNGYFFVTGKRFNLITDYLEHGLCFTETIESARTMGYVNRPLIKNIYTFGNRRKEVIEGYLKRNGLKGRKVNAIGPYILGASNFYDKDKLDEIKSKYGKILLVYPCHSFENNNVSYDADYLIEEIGKIRDGFDSVFLCLYWKDIKQSPELVELYKKAGFYIVCNGHRSDPYFLSRQKDLIQLSDLMLTNGIGTHIGYSVCMKKPVWFVKQPMHYVDDKKKSVEIHKSVIEAEDRIQKAFGDFSFEITKEQVELVEEYWGTWKRD